MWYEFPGPDAIDMCDVISLANPGGLSSHDSYDVR